MNKRSPNFWLILFLTAAGLTTAVFAQTFFTGATTNTTTPNTSYSAPTGNRSMSADEFARTVDKLSQQNSATLNQQSQNLTNQGVAAAAQQYAKTTPAAPQAGTPTNQTITVTPAAPGQATMPAQPATLQPPMPTQAPPPPTQVYTGFGTSAPNSNSNANTRGTTSAPAPSSSGGWNIKY